MTLPGVSINILDGQLGVLPQSPAGLFSIMAPSSAGTANTKAIFTRASDAVAAYGYGPGPQLAAFMLNQGVPAVILGKPHASDVTSGTDTSGSSIVFVGTGTSVITATGNALDSYDVKFLVTLGGTRGTGPIKFQVSLDGGITYAPVVTITTATTYLIPNTGITLHFAAGTLVTGDTATFTTVEPYVSTFTNTTTFGTGLTQWEIMLLGGPVTGAIAALFDAQLSLFASEFRYVDGLCGARIPALSEVNDDATYQASLDADFASFSSIRTLVAGGHARIPSPIDKMNYRRSSMWLMAVRAAKAQIHESLGKVKTGQLKGGYIVDSNDNPIAHDERIQPGLDANRFATLRTYIGQPGVFCTRPLLMSSPGSDFSELQFGRVMNEACRTTYATMLLQVNDDVRIDKTTGFILEADARSIENANNSALRNALLIGGHASNALTVVSRTDNISSTKSITVNVSVQPLGYKEFINVTMQFTNPALAAA